MADVNDRVPNIASRETPTIPTQIDRTPTAVAGSFVPSSAQLTRRGGIESDKVIVKAGVVTYGNVVLCDDPTKVDEEVPV